jgi:hypothetical protein
MPNIKLQDVMIIANGTSRYNQNGFDTVLVKTTIQSDEPILDEYYVPSGVTANPGILEVLKLQNLEVTPFKASTLLAGTEDIQTEALNGNPAGTLEDAAKLLLLSIMKKATLVPVTGSTNLYELNYEYKLFPMTSQGQPNTYELQIRVPFDGLGMVNGSRVEVSVILPRFAEVDAANTHGKDTNGQEITELVYDLPNVNRKAVTFSYQIDPLFTIRYNHTQGIEG